MKGATECFECQPKPTPKSFPVRPGCGSGPARPRRGMLQRVELDVGRTETGRLQTRSAWCAEGTHLPALLQVCTLRNTPDKPIHCVVWAKDMLFPLLFGAPEASDLNESGSAGARGKAGSSRVGRQQAEIVSFRRQL